MRESGPFAISPVVAEVEISLDRNGKLVVDADFLTKAAMRDHHDQDSWWGGHGSRELVFDLDAVQPNSIVRGDTGD